MKLSLSFAGSERLHRKVTQRINFLGSNAIEQLLQQAAIDAHTEIVRLVESFTPGKVADLAEATKIQKRNEVGFIYPILKRTGRMLGSLQVRARKRSANPVWTLSVTFRGYNKGGVLNSTIATAHIEGNMHLPSRDFLKLTSGFGAKWSRAVARALLERK